MNLEAHQRFYSKTSALATELKAIENQTKQQEQELIRKIHHVVSTVKAVSQLNATNNPVEKFIQVNFEQIHALMAMWEKKVNSYQTNLEFRKDFGDSLLVFVYGKVKAGKSSLGNYIATGQSDPTPEWLESLDEKLHKPQFFKEAQNTEFGEVIDYSKGFAVGTSETTSCIQGFRTPGFTWVDSPGLHSINGANGDLAKQYSDSADLIVYPCNSAQPGRRSDFEELRKLILAKKRIMVLITRCSEEEVVDFDEEGVPITELVMKSDKNRADQEQYLKQELDLLCDDLGEYIDTSALSISVHYAQHYGNSAEAMKHSGMQNFFDNLSALIESEGIELKKQVPQKNLHALYSLLVSEDSELSVAKIDEQVSTALNAIEKSVAALKFDTEKVQAEIAFEFSFMLDELVDKHAATKDTKALNQEFSTFIDNLISERYEPVLDKHCSEALGNLKGLTTAIAEQGGIAFEDVEREIEINYTKKYQAAGSGIGAVVGGAIGFFAGGPVGMSIGATAGSMVGGEAAKLVDAKGKEKVVVGDNREQVKASLYERGESLIAGKLSQLETAALNQVFTPIKKSFTHISDETSNLKQFISEQHNV
ncbi:dynamin family protein [Vibrio parahaemolyticus]|uniref:dynamin family protein n=1 Tax=Vibrio parahaemolyticus TaxID=670 RepID=UPI001E50D65C|nr:dynamin family protein [Vibrio parahaemolyticus]MCD2151786.1 dynamin family protein [Vibrio parahaemolyticus]HCE3105330.1 dynamin family protein [Vibrio parahaemolyticus]HCJ4668732.1 dynamin family protein [Vibrio parahaemolyticus]